MAADYLSDYAASVAKENAEATRALMLLEKKEGLLGLAWLGLQKAGSLLSGAWSGIAEFFEKGVNWISGEGFRTDQQVADIKASQQYWETVEGLKQKYVTMTEQGIKNNLLYWGIDAEGNVTIKARELHAMGEREEQANTNAIEVAISQNGSKVLGDINWALGKALGVSAEEAFKKLAEATGKDYKTIQQEMNEGKMKLENILELAGINGNPDVAKAFIDAYIKVSQIRANKELQKISTNKITQASIQQTGILHVIETALAKVYTSVTHYVSNLLGYPGVTLDNGTRLPIQKDIQYTITSGFGERTDPTNPSNGKEFHTGIDIAVVQNTPVLAVADGVVIRADKSESYGRIVVIQHENKIITLYAHNNELKVKVGDEVRAGQLIALSGNTGDRTTGPHIHFEITKDLDYKDFYAMPRINRVNPLEFKWNNRWFNWIK